MIKRTVNFLINWFVILTIPFLGGLFLTIVFIKEVKEGKHPARAFATGKERVF